MPHIDRDRDRDRSVVQVEAEKRRGERGVTVLLLLLFEVITHTLKTGRQRVISGRNRKRKGETTSTDR